MITYSSPMQTGDAEAALAGFWKGFHERAAGALITSILAIGGEHEDPHLIEGRLIDGEDTGTYEAARRACIRRVQAIVRECERNNEQFTDPEFDIKSDLYNAATNRDCLRGLPVPSTQETSAWDAENPGANAHSIESQQTQDQKYTREPRRSRPAYYRYEIENAKQPKSAQRVGEIFKEPVLAPGCAGIHLPSVTSDSTDSKQPKIERLAKKAIRILVFAVVMSHQVASAFKLLAGREYLVPCAGTVFFTLMLLSMHWTTPKPRGALFASSEIMQGSIGDCWFLSAIASLSSRNDLLQKICVAWNRDCGVYGFVFYRDGEWTYTVVDDYLYLTACDFHASARSDTLRASARYHQYREVNQTGSSALHFAQCRNSNQYWLPLLEKAYAKLLGDYSALSGGWTQEGIEELTGGVASTIRTDSVMDIERLWNEFRQIRDGSVFALSSAPEKEGPARYGLVSGHAYSIEDAVTYFDFSALKWIKLLRIRNPWGTDEGVWRGAYARGSKEMTPFASWWLGQGAEDGTFYMTLEDARHFFLTINRARIFDETWTRRQCWTKLIVSWIPQYNQVYFLLTLHRKSEVVLSLSQLEVRYFRGLEGRYVFHLEFLVRKRGSKNGEYVARATAADDAPQEPRRSVSLEKVLDEGTYEVLAKVTAFTYTETEVWSVEDTIRQSTKRPKKLQQIARNYDSAFNKLVDVNPPPAKAKKKVAQDDEWGASGNETDSKETESEMTPGPVGMISDPAQVAWNAVCGAGLRVFSKDRDMELELRHRDRDIEASGDESDDVEAESWNWRGWDAKEPELDLDSDQDWRSCVNDEEDAWNASDVESLD